MKPAPGAALLLAVDDGSATEWEQQFRASAAGRDVRAWPDRVGDPADVRYACVWKPPRGLLARFPNLAAIFSLGAGVDHLMNDPDLPGVPVVRIVDPDLTGRMCEYVALHVLLHHRGLRLYQHQQQQRRWHEHPRPIARDVTVGIMGFGVLGRAAADVLLRIGFQVVAFSRHPRPASEVELFHGAQGLEAFAARTEILVCLLPQTPGTQGILNLKLFRRLKRDGPLGGAYLINAGRGLLQVDADIITALDEGALSGASLDVFPIEPLRQDSPLWAHPGVVITPHSAAFSDPRPLTANVLAQIARFEGGLALQNVADRRLGY
jgi:glyoxylate/hydroxypyruvate reductase A